VISGELKLTYLASLLHQHLDYMLGKDKSEQNSSD